MNRIGKHLQHLLCNGGYNQRKELQLWHIRRDVKVVEWDIEKKKLELLQLKEEGRRQRERKSKEKERTELSRKCQRLNKEEREELERLRQLESLLQLKEGFRGKQKATKKKAQLRQNYTKGRESQQQVMAEPKRKQQGLADIAKSERDKRMELIRSKAAIKIENGDGISQKNVTEAAEDSETPTKQKLGDLKNIKLRDMLLMPKECRRLDGEREKKLMHEIKKMEERIAKSQTNNEDNRREFKRERLLMEKRKMESLRLKERKQALKREMDQTKEELAESEQHPELEKERDSGDELLLSCLEEKRQMEQLKVQVKREALKREVEQMKKTMASLERCSESKHGEGLRREKRRQRLKGNQERAVTEKTERETVEENKEKEKVGTQKMVTAKPRLQVVQKRVLKKEDEKEENKQDGDRAHNETELKTETFEENKRPLSPQRKCPVAQSLELGQKIPAVCEKLQEQENPKLFTRLVTVAPSIRTITVKPLCQDQDPISDNFSKCLAFPESESTKRSVQSESEHVQIKHKEDDKHTAQSEKMSSSGDPGEEDNPKYKSMTGRIVGWINNKMRERHQKKMEKSLRREKTSGRTYKLISTIQGTEFVPVAQYEQQKRARLIKKEEKRQAMESRWRQWEEEREKNKAEKRLKNKQKDKEEDVVVEKKEEEKKEESMEEEEERAYEDIMPNICLIRVLPVDWASTMDKLTPKCPSAGNK